MNGARSGLVTASLASIRLNLCVATEMSSTSPAGGRSGNGRPLRRTAAAMPATMAPYADSESA
jgi:hypothetical protein